MCGLLSLRKAALCAAGALVIFLTSTRCRAELFWSEDFESYAKAYSIDGKGSSWQIVYPEPDTHRADLQYLGWIESANVHSGNRALQMLSYEYSGPDFGGSLWQNDMDPTPRGGLIDFSWWMYVGTTYPNTDPHWRVAVLGTNGNIVVQIGDEEVASGSMSKIDVQSTAGWTETQETMTSKEWHQVKLEVDFAASPNRYRVWADQPGTWTDWCSLGTNETSLRGIEFLGRLNGAGTSGIVYFDDMSGTTAFVTPEPSTLSMLAAFGLAGAGLVWRRRRRA